jgi:hypothetical protein
MGQENLIVEQQTITEEKELIPSLEIAEVGMTSEELIENLFNAYNIKKFSYTKYHPEESHYIEGHRNKLKWENWEGNKNQFRELSEKISKFEILEFEGMKLNIITLMGLGSKVELQDGSIKQMLMLDFEIADYSPMDLLEILDLNLPRGAILKTDHAFHYYGFELMEEDEWYNWMGEISYHKYVEDNDWDQIRTIGPKNCCPIITVSGPPDWKGNYDKLTPNNFTLVGYFDKSSKMSYDYFYMDMSMRRGFSALRLYGYPDTPKRETPYVVRKTQ